MLLAKYYDRGARPVDCPEVVMHNANGDVVLIEVWNQLQQTVQVEFVNNKHGELTVRLRGWGNKPIRLGNWAETNVDLTIPIEEQTHCEDCNERLGLCVCS